MSPDPRSRRKPKRQHDQDEVRTRPSPDDAHDTVYFRRRREEDAGRTVPGQLFLRGCPANVHARITAVLTAVARAVQRSYAAATKAIARSRPATRCEESSVRGKPSGPVSAPVTWAELADVETEDF